MLVSLEDISVEYAETIRNHSNMLSFWLRKGFSNFENLSRNRSGITCITKELYAQEPNCDLNFICVPGGGEEFQSVRRYQFHYGFVSTWE